MPALEKPNFPYPPRNLKDPLHGSLLHSWLFHEGAGTYTESPDLGYLLGGAAWATAGDWAGGDGGPMGPGVHCTNATSDRIDLGFIDGSSTPTGGGTFGFVIDYKDTLQGTLAWASADGGLSTESLFLLHRPGGQLYFLDDYGNALLSATGVLTDGVHAIVIERLLSTIRVYVDGVPVMTTNGTLTPATTFGYGVLGSRSISPNAVVQDTRYLAAAVWNGRLFPQDIVRWSRDPYCLWRPQTAGEPKPVYRIGEARNVTP